MTDVVQINTVKHSGVPQKELELPWKSKTPAAVLYTQKPTLITAIADRLPSIYLPFGSRDQSASGQYEWVITSDQTLDLTTATLDFNCTLTNAKYVNNIANIINRMEVYWNDTNLEILPYANVTTNLFMAMACAKQWMQCEGNALMGIFNQACWGRSQTGADTAGTELSDDLYNGSSSTVVGSLYKMVGCACTPSGSRLSATDGSNVRNYTNCTYQIPLSVISGLFRISNVLPLLGGKLRIKIFLAPANEVCGYFTTDAGTYSLSNMELHVDQVVLERPYRDMISQTADTSQGFTIPFISYQTGLAQGTGSQLLSFRIPYNLTNGLSLHLARETSAQRTPVAVKWLCPKISYPCEKFGSLVVKSGSKYFTPSQGITSYSELYRMCELTHNNFCDISGSGIIDMKMMQDPYTVQTVSGSGNLILQAGFCPMSVNLEKTTEADTDVTLNSGLNAGDGFTELQVDLTASANNTWASTDYIYWTIVHKRYIKVANRAVTCMF